MRTDFTAWNVEKIEIEANQMEKSKVFVTTIYVHDKDGNCFDFTFFGGKENVIPLNLKCKGK